MKFNEKCLVERERLNRVGSAKAVDKLITSRGKELFPLHSAEASCWFVNKQCDADGRCGGEGVGRNALGCCGNGTLL
jgi:hypothetical protein